MYRYYPGNYADPNAEEIISLLDGSGVRCSRLLWTGVYRGAESHAAALVEGIIPAVIDRFTTVEDVEIGTPTMVEELPSPLAVMSMVEYYYHNPVYTCERTQAEFDRLYRLLFPSGRRYECFAWSDDWCDFFDAGKEWFGTGCWSVYDTTSGAFTLFFVSETD